ncbi:hypothetical protein D9M70_543930 [compost metagenome]
MQLGGDAPANLPGDARGAAVEMRAVGNVQVGLVQGQRFDDLGVVAEYLMDLPRHRLVHVHARPDDGQVRTQLDRRPHRHRRTHAVGAGVVIAGRHDPTLVRRAANRQGLTRQRRVVAHLDGGVEAIAVNVDDLSLRHGDR